jgi:hypothetical protein
MHQAPLPYFSPPAATNPKAFQKFATLFPGVNMATAAAVSNLNPFSIESLLAASPQTAAAAAAVAVHQHQSQRLNYNHLLTSNSSPNIQAMPQDLYG